MTLSFFARYVLLHLWGEIHLHVDVYFSSAHVCFRIKNLCAGSNSDFIKKLNWEFSLSPQIFFFFLVWATPRNWLEYCSYLRHNIVFVLYTVRFICTWHKIQFFGKAKKSHLENPPHTCYLFLDGSWHFVK